VHLASCMRCVSLASTRPTLLFPFFTSITYTLAFRNLPALDRICTAWCIILHSSSAGQYVHTVDVDTNPSVLQAWLSPLQLLAAAVHIPVSCDPGRLPCCRHMHTPAATTEGLLSDVPTEMPKHMRYLQARQEKEMLHGTVYAQPHSLLLHPSMNW